ncbi:MAG: hypothetical protein IPJ60_09575 [Sphingobacteriaceae bacterium]|nr:hypothetical protein [Sphingobacteriaceae bacterium]
MKKLISLTVILVCLTSCQAIMKKMYGIKDPDIENERTIKKAATKYKLDPANIVTVTSDAFLKELSGKSIPDVAVFDSNGNYIEYRVTDTSCNAGLFKFIPELNLKGNYNKTGLTNLQAELIKFRDLVGKSVGTSEKADFYLHIYWTVWTGKLNKDHVKIWEDLAVNNKNCKIKTLTVNLDIQEYWGKSKCDSILNKLNKKN